MSDTTLATVDRINVPSLIPANTAITCNEDSTIEQLEAMNNRIEFAYEQANDDRKARDNFFIEYIKKRGPFTLGQKRYWLTKPKKEKVRKLLDAVQAVLSACQGDEEAFVRALSVNALKVGQCRTLLGADFNKHFETVVRDKLETGEAAPLELACQDEAFIKPKRK